MEHAVLAALVGSSPDVRMKNGEIQKHLSLGNCGTILRPDVILKTLDQLWKKGLIDKAEVDGGKTGYFLTTPGQEQANRDAGLGCIDILPEPTE